MLHSVPNEYNYGRTPAGKPVDEEADNQLQPTMTEWLPLLRRIMGYGKWPAVSAGMSLNPEEASRRFWYDSVLWNPHALDYLVQTVGQDRVVQGTDYPFDLCEWRGAGNATYMSSLDAGYGSGAILMGGILQLGGFVSLYAAVVCCVILSMLMNLINLKKRSVSKEKLAFFSFGRISLHEKSRFI
jgi:hypothetical protein